MAIVVVVIVKNLMYTVHMNNREKFVVAWRGQNVLINGGCKVKVLSAEWPPRRVFGNGTHTFRKCVFIFSKANFLKYEKFFAKIGYKNFFGGAQGV